MKFRRSRALCCVLFLLVWQSDGLKLKVSHEECIGEEVSLPESLVTASLLSLAQPPNKAFFNIKVTDPSGVLVYHKEGIDDAEFSFQTRLPGTHLFCLEVHKSSAHYPAELLREVALEIDVGQTWSHDRVTRSHLDPVLEHLSELASRIQRLKSEVKYLRTREERHRQTVDSTDRRVRRYALIKAAVLVLVATAQVTVIQYFFRAGSA